MHGNRRYTANKSDTSPKPKPIRTADSIADTEVVKGGRKDTINSAFGIDKSQKNGIIKEKRNSKFDPLKEEKDVPVLRKDSDGWIDRLTKEEKRAIKKYTKNSGDSGDNKFFKRLNAMLRGDLKKDDTLSYYAEHISNALKKNVLMHDIVCYRSADENFFSDFGIGDLVFHDSFLALR